VAGTPTEPPDGDSIASQQADGDCQAWERPVPTRWAPPAEMTARTVPMNETVMRTAPGEAPVSR
jgi:hypothetical protein